MNRQHGTKPILSKIETHLLPDERLLWLGKPSWRRLPTFPNIGVELVAAIVVGTLVILMTAGIVFIRTSDTPVLTGFLLLSLLTFIVLIPVAARYFAAENTIYAVTTHRALIFQGGKLTSFGAADINVLECEDTNDGTGDVIFKTMLRERMLPTGYLPFATEVEEKVGFFGIPNPRHVHELLLHTFRTSPISMWQDKPLISQRSPAKA